MFLTAWLTDYQGKRSSKMAGLVPVADAKTEQKTQEH